MEINTHLPIIHFLHQRFCEDQPQLKLKWRAYGKNYLSETIYHGLLLMDLYTKDTISLLNYIDA